MEKGRRTENRRINKINDMDKKVTKGRKKKRSRDNDNARQST
jgi:hypothetical protein